MCFKKETQSEKQGSSCCKSLFPLLTRDPSKRTQNIDIHNIRWWQIPPQWRLWWNSSKSSSWLSVTSVLGPCKRLLGRVWRASWGSIFVKRHNNLILIGVQIRTWKAHFRKVKCSELRFKSKHKGHICKSPLNYTNSKDLVQELDTLTENYLWSTLKQRLSRVMH